MRILVTGAAGFIGSHLCEKLHALGHDVTGLDNFNGYYDESLKRVNAADLAELGIAVLEKDLVSNLSGVFESPYDYVYHLAAQPGISAGTTLEEYVRNNIFATQRLLDAATHSPGLKCFVNISTSSVYGRLATVDEESVPQPISFYGTTKWAAEQLVLGYQREGKIKACSMRLYSVYGPRERPEKLYTKLIENLHNGKPFPLFEGSAGHERSFTYVGDIVDGLAAIIGREDTVDGEIINLGTDEVNTTMDGIRAVEKIMGKTLEIDKRPARKGDQLRTAAVIGKAKKLLDYKPSVSLKDGLAKQVEWYLAKFGKKS